MDTFFRTRSLIDRLSRLSASDSWGHDINPGQAAALAYLAQANRFSRAPSHVAAYLGSTRGTVGQTLKALSRKGLVREGNGSDKRSIRYDVTAAGAKLATEPTGTMLAIAALPENQLNTLNGILSDLLREMLDVRQGQSFGVCRTCKHHADRPDGSWCRLLEVELSLPEKGQICHEHHPATA